MTSWNMPRLSSKDLINGRMKMILKTVGINFDDKTKVHTCKIETVTK